MQQPTARDAAYVSQRVSTRSLSIRSASSVLRTAVTEILKPSVMCMSTRRAFIARQVICCTNGCTTAVAPSVLPFSRTLKENSFFVSKPRTHSPFASRYSTRMSAAPSTDKLSPITAAETTSGVTMHLRIFWISAQ